MVKGVGSKIKWKRKRWFNIVSPGFLGESVIGQTPAMEGAQVTGRNMRVSVPEVVKDSRKQDYTLILKVSKVSGGNAATFVKSFEVSPSQVKRSVRKGGSKIDINDFYETKDNKKLNVKSVVLTASKCETKKRTEIRKSANDKIKKSINEKTYEEFVREVLFGKFQTDIKKSLIKLQPARFVEVIKFINLSE